MTTSYKLEKTQSSYDTELDADDALVAGVESAFAGLAVDFENGHVSQSATEDLQPQPEYPLPDRGNRWLGSMVTAGRTVIEKAQDGYDYVNARLGLGYSAIVERTQAKAAAKAEKGSRRISGKVWVMGAVAVGMVVTRSHSFGLFDGIEADGAVFLDGPSGHDGLSLEPTAGNNIPTATIAYRPLAAHSELALPQQNQQPVIPAPNPDPFDDREILKWGDLDNNGVDDIRQFKASLDKVGQRIGSWFVAESTDQSNGSGPSTTVDDPRPTSTTAPTRTVAPTPSPLPSLAPTTTAPAPSGSGAFGPDSPSTSASVIQDYRYDVTPNQDEYMWDYMRRIGIPADAIMRELEEAAAHDESTDGDTVEWYGSGSKRWLKIKGKSDTVSLWGLLQGDLKAVANN